MYCVGSYICLRSAVVLAPSVYDDDDDDGASPEGMQLLLREVGDEASSVQPVVRLPSAAGAGTDVDDELKAGPVLFMLPGVEGVASVLEPLAKNLEYQAVCLQLNYWDIGETVHDMAQSLLPVCVTRLLSDSITAVIISGKFHRKSELLHRNEYLYLKVEIILGYISCHYLNQNCLLHHSFIHVFIFHKSIQKTIS
jgi:hypothetical protein